MSEQLSHRRGAGRPTPRFVPDERRLQPEPAKRERPLGSDSGRQAGEAW
jgi:hypothetical protein